MKLREIRIKNFRCLSDVSIPIEDNTVLVGENNSGKTAFLDALRIALPRTTAGRRAVFDEYDYYMVKASDSPQSSEGIIIELWFREDSPDEWPDSLIQALSEIIQTDPMIDIDVIGLRLSSKYDETMKEIVTKWEFLAMDGQPLGGRGASPANLSKFLTYIRLFYLSSLRDSTNEFSPRSQFWGQILRDLKISEEQREEISEELTRLNEALLGADPRLEQVRATLEESQKIMKLGSGQETSIQALPLRPWDLMSKSEVIVKSSGTEVAFPLSRHGQGAQNLAVLFLFQAYIQVLLQPTFEPETKAILALEEPEAHLHPQATQSLAANLDKIESQKLISTHSPYFIQEIPFKQIRMFRRKRSSSEVVYLKRSFSGKVPANPELLKFCAKNDPKYSFHEGTSILSVRGKMEKGEYRDLLGIYPGQPEIHAHLKRLHDESQMFLTDNDLRDLDTYAKRIRGEVLFASAWLLCEGQSDYLILRYFAELMGKPFDQGGVSVIDFQNNGSPGSFVGLAHAFEIPWVMVCDNDDEGKKFVKQVEARGLTNEQIEELVRVLPGEGMDLEGFLIEGGFALEFIQILGDKNISVNKAEGEVGFREELSEKIKKDKARYARALVEKLRQSGADQDRVPKFFQEVINYLIAKVT